MKDDRYSELCSEDDCYEIVSESDIERNQKGEIYDRSKKCWDCRTKQDREAIKRFRKNNRPQVINK